MTAQNRPAHAPPGPLHAHRVHRVEVRPRPGIPDARADSAASKARRAGLHVQGARTAKVYLLQGDLDAKGLDRVVASLLADPVTELATIGTTPAPAGAALVEVHPLAGVMDPAAQSIQLAIRGLLGREVRVSTGARYEFAGIAPGAIAPFARQALGNPVVHQIIAHPWLPDSLPEGQAYAFAKRTIPLRGLTDDQLTKLSRDAHLFLNLDEVRAIRAEFERVGRDPTDIELETIAQTWSEHCVHKTLKATIRYREETPQPRAGAQARSAPEHDLRWHARPGHTLNADGSVTIRNLLKSTVAAATHQLIADGVDWTLSVFKDNSGVIAFDDDWGVCIKVETHNRPSAIEPYGGAATGIGGCIRDVIGTGLGAKPIASTDVFCVADPNIASLPPGVLHPRRVLQEVVAGVRDYGNRMGIPTVSGGVFFDDRYVGNPLVFCGCVGLIPRALVQGKARPGDRIIALGGRTGRDGIHGATFSSAELESSSSTEFAHAVQIGNAIEEKRVLDALLRARDHADGPLFHALTDCGAGGFSSAVGEMGADLGARVTLDTAPTKYAGLSYTEVWISEAQERMVLAVPAHNVGALQRICDEEGVELCDLGEFGANDAQLVLTYQGHEVGRLAMRFLHDGLPNPTRDAVWAAPSSPEPAQASDRPPPTLRDALPALLSHPTVASKHWIIRQYDHEVQGNTIVKPLVGPLARGPGDASVIEPIAGSGRAIALSQGLQSSVGDRDLAGDPYWMTLASIDECVRNLVCVGADPDRIAILDNFCWPSCENPRNLGALVRAAEACYDGAKAYRTPFVSGKDSLSNQLRYTDPASGQPRLIEIPSTLLITGVGIVPDVSRCVTMDAKRPARALIIVFAPQAAHSRGLRGSLYASLFPTPAWEGQGHDPIDAFQRVDLAGGPAAARLVHRLIRDGLAHSAHDVSEGGLLVAIAEMLIAGSSPDAPLGAELCLQGDGPDEVELFAEHPSTYVLEVDADDATLDRIDALVQDAARRAGADLDWSTVGVLDDSGVLGVKASSGQAESWNVEDLARAWRAPLDW
jgi:phosphoribosylformylglycinamidine synthase